MRVAALYRYPLKGFSPEECESLTVLGARVAGDRVLAVRFANAAAQADAWGTKHECVALVNTPGLARLDVAFDHDALRVRLRLKGQVLADVGVDDAGRTRLAAAIQEYVLQLAENPLSSQPDRLPLKVVGDGRTPRYQDNASGQITLHGRASLRPVADAAGVGELSELRFRSNIALEGLEPWQEQGWIGRRLRIGEVEFDAVEPKARCLATHANPKTGERDLPMMKTLLRALPTQKPTFAIALIPRGGGTIRVGDRIRL
jgi:MOSC domain-containing protein